MILEFYKNKEDAKPNILPPMPDDKYSVLDDSSIEFPVSNWYEMYPDGLVLVNGKSVSKEYIKDELTSN